MEKESPTKSEKIDKFTTHLKLIIFVSFLALIVVSWFYFDKFSHELKLSEKQEIWGMFGDYFGGILSPIFAFYALVVLLYSIHLQKIELYNSTEQLKKSAEALEKQNRFIQKQNFEATYFHLLELYNQIIQGLSITTKNDNDKIEKFDKRQCFFPLLLQFNKIKNKHLQTSEGIENLNAVYNLFKDKYEDLIGHYLRTISNILEYIDNSELSEHEKHFYANVLRGQLSLYELALIHFNSLYGNEIKLSIIQKYEIVPENSKHFQNAIIKYPSV